MSWVGVELRKRKYRIVPKRDFGSGPGYFIKGKFVKSGFVVTDGGICNVMPGATWFLTVADAMRALRIWIEVGFNADLFWSEVQKNPS